MISSTSRVSRFFSKGLLLAGIALVPALALKPAAAQDKMMHSKMSHSKMMQGKMSGNMMMSHMTASEKRTYSNMSAKEKALMMKMMHGKM